MKTIQVLGTGCPKCRKLTENVRQAVAALGVECDVVKVTDLNEIARLGAMMTPGLAIDGVLKSSGRVLSPKEIQALL